MSALSAAEFKAVLTRTAEQYAATAKEQLSQASGMAQPNENSAALVNSMMMSVSDLHSHMQNTISQMRGDKTVTETTASVSNNNGAGGFLQRNDIEGVRGDDDDLGLSQLASAVNQISAVQSHQHSVMTGQGSNLVWAEGYEAIDGGQNLQKTQIYETNNKQGETSVNDSMKESVKQFGVSQDKFESRDAVLPYEKEMQAHLSRDETFVKEE